MEQVSQESDEEIHEWDDITGRVVNKVIAIPLSHAGKLTLTTKSTGPMAR